MSFYDDDDDEDILQFSSDMGEPTYFYKVVESMTTFGLDKNNSEPFGDEKNFKGDLNNARDEACKYYNARIEGFENASYHLPFEGFKGFKYGENAAYSCDLYLIEYFPKTGEQFEYNLTDDSDIEDLEEAKSVEADVLLNYR